MPKVLTWRIRMLFLALSLALPGPAWALRQGQVVEGERKTGLEEVLRFSEVQTRPPAYKRITYYDPDQRFGFGAPFCLYNPHSAVVLDDGDMIVSNTYSRQPPIRIDRDGNRSYFVEDDHYISAIVRRHGDLLILVGERGRLGVFDQRGRVVKEVQLTAGYDRRALFISSVFVDRKGDIYLYHSDTGTLEIRNSDLVLQRSFDAGPVGVKNDFGDIYRAGGDLLTWNGGSRVVVTSEGDIVVSHRAVHLRGKGLGPAAVFVFDSEGHLLRSGFFASMDITGMAIDPQDNLFIADRKNRQVYQIDFRDRSIQRADISFDSRYPVDGQELMALDVDPQGNLVVIEGDVHYANIQIIPREQLDRWPGAAMVSRQALPAGVQHLLPGLSSPVVVGHRVRDVEELDRLALERPFSFVVKPIAMVSPVIVPTENIPEAIQRITGGVFMRVNGRSISAFSFMQENVDEFVFSPLVLRSGTVTLSTTGETRNALQEVEGLTSPTVDNAEDQTYRPRKMLAFISLMTPERAALLSFMRHARPENVVVLLHPEEMTDEVSDGLLRMLRITHTMVHEAAHNYLRRLVKSGQIDAVYLEARYSESFASLVQAQFILGLLEYAKSNDDLRDPQVLDFLQQELAHVASVIDQLTQERGSGREPLPLLEAAQKALKAGWNLPAGLEEIALSEQVAAKSLVILTPVTVDALGNLVRLGQGGAPLPVAVVVQDDGQEARIRARLEEAGGTLALQGFINLSRSGQTLREAVVELQAAAWARAVEVFVVETFEQLHGLGRFLKIPDLSFRSWFERLQLPLEEAA